MNSLPKETGALRRTPIKELAAEHYHRRDPAQGREDYGRLDRILSVIQRLFDAISNSSAAISLRIEQWRARIETKRELDKWNRENRERWDHERD